MARILFAEDQTVIREPLAAALKTHGYEVTCVSEGASAVTALASTRPDLVLLDLAMPVMDGYAFLREIRSNPNTANLPVIVLSALADRDHVLAALKLNVQGYLLKADFSLSELIDKIELALAPAGDRPAPSTDAGEPSRRRSNRKDPHPTQPRQSTGPSADRPPDHGRQQPSSTPSSNDEPSPTLSSTQRPQASKDLGTSPATDPRRARQAATGRDDAPVTSAPQSLPQSFKDVKPVMTRSQVKERIDACEELRGFSPTIALLLKRLRNPHVTIDQIVSVASGDHAVALKIMKLANSAAFTRGEPVDSVRKAILRIGLDKLKHTVLSLGVVEQFASDRYDGAIDLGQFWEHSMACGIAAAIIADHSKVLDPDSAFTMGLLHDIGRLVLIEQFADQYPQVVQVAQHFDLPLEQAESRMLLLNHADVMDRALHAWQFPRHLVNPIVFHQLSAANIRQVSPRDLQQVGLLSLANRLVHAMLLGSSANNFVYETHNLWQLLKLEPEVMNEIRSLVPEQTADIKLSMLSRPGNDTWTQYRQVVLDGLTAPVNPHFISTQPQIDAFRLTCEQLCADVEEPPNVIVVHIAHQREVGPLSHKLAAADRELEVEFRLPLVLISPKGSLALDNPVLAERHVQYLHEPVSIPALTRAFNQAVDPAGSVAA